MVLKPLFLPKKWSKMKYFGNNGAETLQNPCKQYMNGFLQIIKIYWCYTQVGYQTSIFASRMVRRLTDSRGDTAGSLNGPLSPVLGVILILDSSSLSLLYSNETLCKHLSSEFFIRATGVRVPGFASKNYNHYKKLNDVDHMANDY